jgi:hypothetical protein
VQWNVPDPDTWNDNWLCANKNVGLTFGSSQTAGDDCTQIQEPSDPDANWASGGYWLCAAHQPTTPGQAAQPPQPPTPPLSCSNAPGANSKAGNTCAAEVFRFSPEIYLSNPDGGSGSGDGDGGMPPTQSITSLPPVL